jgi:hypothetical protein
MIIETSAQTKGISISWRLSYSDYKLGLEHCEYIIKKRRLSSGRLYAYLCNMGKGNR